MHDFKQGCSSELLLPSVSIPERSLPTAPPIGPWREAGSGCCVTSPWVEQVFVLTLTQPVDASSG